MYLVSEKPLECLKGQIEPKADWRRPGLACRRFSQKMNGRICFCCFFTLHGKKDRLFFGRIYARKSALGLI